MLERLHENWVYGGFLSAIMLLALTPVLAADWSFGLILVWLQLPAYMLHQYEEHDDDRFRRLVNATIGGDNDVLSRRDTFLINIFGVWGIDSAAFALAASGHIGIGLVAVYLSLVNSVGHLAQAIALRQYNPGLVTSVVLFIPLGGLTLWVLAVSDQITMADHLIGLGFSMLVHASIAFRVLTQRRRPNLPAA